MSLQSRLLKRESANSKLINKAYIKNIHCF